MQLNKQATICLKNGQRREPLRKIKSFFATIILVPACIVATWLVKTYVISSCIVAGDSMVPTLHPGETYLLNCTHRTLRRGEIVVIRDQQGDQVVKRVIGMPNDQIVIRDGKVFLNGLELQENYLARGTKTLPLNQQRIFVMGSNEYFVMGDNREDSYDSRAYGPITKRQVHGALVASYP
jgi:signal peptidase I